MTLEELRAECDRVKDRGMTYLLLKVAGRARGERKRILPGLYGRVVAPLDGGREGALVEVKADDVSRALGRAKVAP